MDLDLLTRTIERSLGIVHKQDIQAVARFLATENAATDVLIGDDCAAIPDGDSYLLLAAEGMMPDFVATDPWFAGWSAVMVNVSDIYAMGGRPIAVVDTIWSQDTAISQPLLAGMSAAARAYQVPIVGGHTNSRSAYNALSVAILGRARNLISSFQARTGDRLLMAIDLRGKLHPKYPFWNAATETDPNRLRADLELLPKLAENGLCAAGKDISMGGVIGTTLMLLETSQCGAILNLDAIPRPAGISFDRWLVSFPSYGFLLSVRPDRVSAVQQVFGDRHITCTDIGEVIKNPQLILKSQQQSTIFWDFTCQHLTGFR
ncbi:sll0787 family AIR synthase-like protein [Chamaesiphon minutus]|uniref:AIR synthase-related protein, sll0787 family n=1 Tax=Chamaesiphon minutus (strain ATCC 27169 / PCC 6605) TaxID=1173020 RepID=K9UGA8_CHAP6|nr:sll0787 family AIR synthase-like protein [Chamaesiphon minutus]AFY93456.1 AIR synthase-related protein, sll0787 family [Chamaesiphon minutus PCC 6605]